MLHAIDQKGLQMTVQDYVTEDWEGKPVEVFFRTRNPEGPVLCLQLENIENPSGL